jgi:uncharacterized membrane-anchored protein
MSKTKLLFPAFILVAIIQVYVPARMIWNREEVLGAGKEYLFKAAPVDPNDPLRGKFITLRYDESTVAVENEQDWKPGEAIYIYLTTDSEGFAKIKSVSKERSAGDRDFVKANVWLISRDGSHKLTIRYPFDRYYMEESKAFAAEQTYNQSLQDTSKVTYALVSIKDGDAVLKDVLINGTSIREIVKKNQEKQAALPDL